MPETSVRSLKVIVFKCFHKVSQLEFEKAFYGLVFCFTRKEQEQIETVFGCVYKSGGIWVCRLRCCVEVCEANQVCPWELK